jgi:predicted nucleic acid binding AN1-type Zn finger protein
MADHPSVRVRVVESAGELWRMITAKSSEENNEKSRRIFSSIDQMWKSFARIAITSKALCETKPSWQAVDNWTNRKIRLHAFANVIQIAPIVVREIKTREKLEIHQSGDERVELIGEPEISKLHGKEWR